MNNRSNAYWNKRANERMASYHKNSDETIRKITKAYDKAIKDINDDIHKIFYKYQIDGDLSTAEARDLLNSKIPKRELNRIRSKIHSIENEDLKRYMMAQLNADAYKSRITRLEALKESIYINTKLAADVEINQSEKLYTDNINEAYYNNIFDIQKGLGIGFNVAEMPLESIQEILKNNWSGKHYSQRIWHNTDVLVEKLEEVITSGLMSGKSSRRMAQDLRELTNYGKFACERIIRTETTYISNASEIESYKECGIDKYVFIATLDLRTSKQCREKDKKIYNVKYAETGVNLPPLHPYCRSTTIAYKDEETLNNLKRRARDPETGKTYILPSNMNYQEWYDKFVVDKYGKDKTEIFEKMIKNKSSDRKQLEKIKEYLGKEAPKTLKGFQELKYNNIKEWELVKDYVKSRELNMISVFSPFEDLKKYKNIIEKEIVGIKTANGIEIKSQSKHFIERVLGTSLDPEKQRPRDGIEIDEIYKTLTKPLKVKEESKKNSHKFIGEKVTITINPNTGNLIQCNTTDSNLVRRLKNV